MIRDFGVYCCDWYDTSTYDVCRGDMLRLELVFPLISVLGFLSSSTATNLLVHLFGVFHGLTNDLPNTESHRQRISWTERVLYMGSRARVSLFVKVRKSLRTQV